MYRVTSFRNLPSCWGWLSFSIKGQQLICSVFAGTNRRGHVSVKLYLPKAGRRGLWGSPGCRMPPRFLGSPAHAVGHWVPTSVAAPCRQVGTRVCQGPTTPCPPPHPPPSASGPLSSEQPRQVKWHFRPETWPWRGTPTLSSVPSRSCSSLRQPLGPVQPKRKKA